MGRMTEVREDLHALLTAIIKHLGTDTICSDTEEEC